VKPRPDGLNPDNQVLGPVLLLVAEGGGVGRVDMGVGVVFGLERKGSTNARITEMISRASPPRKQKSPSTAQPPLAAPVSCTELELVGNAPVTLMLPCQEMIRETNPMNTRMVASVNSHWDLMTYFRSCCLFRGL